MTAPGPRAIIDWLLESGRAIDTTPLPTLEDWLPRFARVRAEWTHSVDRAIAGGFLADRLAYAFAAGYESALGRLVPSLDDGATAALCVTEEGGGHPKAIRTTLVRDGDASWRMTGRKKFVSMAADAKRLFVAATRGARDDGTSDLRLVAIDLPATGVAIELMKDLPFIPEIRHGALAIHNATVADDQILPGDGYTDYIKPFRTIEDIHVTAAAVAFACRCACLFGWPSPLRERMLTALVTLRTLSDDDPSSPAVHILYAGAAGMVAEIMREAQTLFDAADEATHAAWARDSALLDVAGSARAARRAKAWEHYN